MPIVAVKRLTNGVKLAEDVHTSLGGLLFAKGTPVSEREKEFLEAFLVDQVNVEEMESAPAEPKKEETVKEKESTPVKSKPVGFHQQFEKAIFSLKGLLQRVQGGQNIPVMEVREVIAPILKLAQEQPNVLLALPKATNVDSYTYTHSIVVGLLSYMIAKWMKIPEREWMQVALAGTLLDVGKTKVHPRILQKPGKLTQQEFEEMKKHTVYGYQVIKASTGLSEGVALAALQHHEREDGSGYPLGLPGSKLHLYSKITAVADVYHAMCSDRIYRKAASPYVVVEQLIQDSFGKLDPTIVHTFVNGITQFSVGMAVELSDGTIGKIIFNDRNHPTRPMVESNGKIIDLKTARQLSIARVL
ncbi:HD-GYP domain-containing protein [Brevibacillus migulae]|uniref:HD-GYP domain-containing protein n=1 Tax=Brevibacillus migulae TaxID=1644114 RepID=UPI00106EEDBD|nr:HD-GYP domain-containing protein [Brevibacillus migulae]